MNEEIKVEEVKEEVVLKKLDIACGTQKQEGFIGIDIAGDVADIIHDLDIYPWPFEDNSIDEVYCCHYLEHSKEIMKFMNECYRIMKPEAQMMIISPYYSSVRAMQDPTHVNFISEMTFLYYNKKWREDNKLGHYPINCDFDYTYGYAFHPNWQIRSEEARNYALIHYINVVTDIQVMMKKRND
jgi:SAM-dependent methyltransferase